jgi:ATP-binding cassette subfamily B protein
LEGPAVFRREDSMSFDDEDSGQRVLSNRQVLTFLFKQWMRRPRLLAVIGALFMGATLCDLILPKAAGAMVDAVSGEGDAGAAWGAFFMFASIWALFCLLRNTGGRLMTPFASGNMHDMIIDAFRRVQMFSAQWHADTFAGATVRKISRGFWAYDTLTDVLCFGLIPSMIVLTGLSIQMFLKWPLVGLYVAVVVAVFVAAAVLLSERYTKRGATVANRLDSRIGGALSDAIGNNAAVKGFGAEAREVTRFVQVVDRWKRACQVCWYRFTNAWLVSNVLLIVLQSGLLALLIREWSAGRATTGDVAFAISAFLVMSGHLRNFGDNVQMLQRGLSEIEDIAIFDRTAPQIDDAPRAPAFAPGKGEIVFDKVRFSYANQNEAIYEDVNLRIAPGETVALVGPTGAGKSTFVRLIQRLYDVDGGAIRIDGQDIRQVAQSSLRAHIAVVPQDPALFHRSVADNIAYGAPDAPYEEIIAAATRARAHGFIARLPKGYRTLVGERGVKLSGGERQRVALARAFLANTPILILDEATSSLDNETERDVQAAMHELKEGRTTIIIAHRLSTIREADRILVFDGGRIVEQGRHAELVALKGLYARLHAMAEGEMLPAA